MKEEDSIKYKKTLRGRYREIERKILYQSRVELVIKLEKKYIRTDLLGLCREQFSLD